MEGERMPAHSFILYFKQFLKRHYKHFLEVMTLILFLALGEMILEYLLIKDETYERTMMHDFYQTSENIDYLYLGSSHVYCDINPHILDDINGKNNFNLATSAQPLIASYYLLKEADKRNDLECVYVDLYFPLLMGEHANWREPDGLARSWLVMNQMEFSINKLDWIMHSTRPRYVYLSLIPSIRYKNRILDFEYLAERWNEKSQASYLNYNDCGNYVRKGYNSVDKIAEELYYERTRESFKEPTQLAEDAKEYLSKIIEYCDANDIELRLFANPLSGWVICRDVRDYDKYVVQMKEFVSEFGLEYYDFNLCKKEYLDISDHMYWIDDNHLNVRGAEIYTNFFGDFFEKIENGEIQSDDYFYDSYQQKLNDIDEEVFGLVIEEIDDERKADYFATTGIQADCDDYRLFLLSTENNLRNDKVEFYVYSVDMETGEKIYIQDWSENNVYVLPADVEECRICVKVRAAKTKQEYGKAIIGY